MTHAVTLAFYLFYTGYSDQPPALLAQFATREACAEARKGFLDRRETAFGNLDRRFFCAASGVKQ